MDASPASLIGTNACGLLMTVTVFCSCLPSFLAIKDIQLKVSIAIFFLSFILNLITSIFAWRALSQGNLDDFGRMNITAAVFFITAFIAQSFYSLRRTCMIYNLSPRVQLYLPIAMTVCQCVIQYTEAAYWCIDMLRYYGATVSRQTSETTIASIVWILTTEPVYFALLQYKIVKSATSFQRASKERSFKTAWLWVEAIMRLTLYILTVLFTYLAVSEFIKPTQLAYWSMINCLPANVGLIFLTDVGRFQKALGKNVDGISKGSSGKNSHAQDIRTEIIEANKDGPAVFATPKRTNLVGSADAEMC
ncbi:hypothetical protein HK104_001431 [Borealophlyctis nickersoniae]|nr:hypothetical protein HK104_001431 [Borealophlyctis nickersoniae]